jgi:hypothetical protein
MRGRATLPTRSRAAGVPTSFEVEWRLNANVLPACRVGRSNRGLLAFNGFLADKSMRLFALRIAGSSELAELLGVSMTSCR